MIQYEEGKTKSQQDTANQILQLLDVCYPNHPWAVRVGDGFIFIRHLAFGTNWGMNIKTKEVDHDAAVLRRKVIMLAGEWLERAGLRRGVGEDQINPYKVEGVPDIYQPPEFKPALTPQSIIAIESNEPLRTEPRPQALKQEP